MPVDPETGKEYPYTEEGIEQHRKDTGNTPFTMRGNPFQRNFGIGSPVKQQFGKPTDTKSGEPKSGEPRSESQSGEGKAMQTFKTKKIPTVNLPKEIKSKLPKTPRKDTLKGLTQFEYDVIPVTNVLQKQAQAMKKVYYDNPKKIVKKLVEADKRNIKKVKDYFTKR